jgi:hypothetical protein
VQLVETREHIAALLSMDAYIDVREPLIFHTLVGKGGGEGLPLGALLGVACA